jgi:hypothetical protein
MDNDDILAITQVMAHYPHVIDAKQWDRIDELYTDDGVFDLTGLVGSELRFEGIDAIKGFLTASPMPLAHVSTDHYVFEVDGVVQSRGKWFFPGDDGTITGGVYRDTWEKIDRGWRMKERLVFNWQGAEGS